MTEIGEWPNQGCSSGLRKDCRNFRHGKAHINEPKHRKIRNRCATIKASKDPTPSAHSDGPEKCVSLFQNLSLHGFDYLSSCLFRQRCYTMRPPGLQSDLFLYATSLHPSQAASTLTPVLFNMLAQTQQVNTISVSQSIRCDFENINVM